MAKFASICCNIVDGDWIESKDQSERGVRLLQTGNIGVGEYLDNHRRARYISLDTFGRLKCTEVFQGDILISRLPDPVGRACIVPQSVGKAIAAVDCTIVRLNNSLCNKRYFINYTQSERYYNELSKFLAGTTRTRISRKNLEKIEVPLPSLDEQRRIAAVLDKVSDLIAKRRQQLEKLDELVKARFVEMFGEPGTDKFGWGLRKLGDCCEINPKKAQDKRLTLDVEVSFVPMPTVGERGEFDASDIRCYREVRTGFTYFRENDVLFAKITPCMENGKGAIAKGLRNGVGFGSTEFHVMRPVAGVSTSHWLYTMSVLCPFRIEAEANMTGSAGQRRVPASFLKGYLVALPPIERQESFEAFAVQEDKVKCSVQKNLRRLEALKKSLMQRYFE